MAALLTGNARLIGGVVELLLIVPLLTSTTVTSSRQKRKRVNKGKMYVLNTKGYSRNDVNAPAWPSRRSADRPS